MKRWPPHFLLLWLAFWCGIRSVQAAEPPVLETIIENGPSNLRINVVVLSEGYTAEELPQFSEDARQAVEYLLNTPPYREYRSLFNAYAIAVASAESGSDHPSRGVFRDTYFNSTYDSFGQGRLITIPPNDHDPNYSHGQGIVDMLLFDLVPDYDISILLVNDPEYGGFGGFLGPTPVFSKHPDSSEIMVHELGHAFAYLGDEYTDTLTTPGLELANVTQETNRTSIKWKSWIANDTPIPTPLSSDYSGAVGLFAGANLRPSGWYRPRLNCKMRTLGVPFCEICAQELVRSFYRVLRPIEAAYPEVDKLTLTKNEGVQLSVQPLQPETHSLSIQWYQDESAISDATNTTFVTFGALLGPGSHTFKAVVRDATPLVRDDPNKLLQDSRTWVITVPSDPPVAYLVNPAWDASGGFEFQVSGSTAQSVVIESSTNLIDWLPILERPSGSAFGFRDSDAVRLPRRFYRARLTP